MEQYLAYITAVYMIANIITRVTPTKKDDEVMGKVNKIWKLIFEATRKK